MITEIMVETCSDNNKLIWMLHAPCVALDVTINIIEQFEYTQQDTLYKDKDLNVICIFWLIFRNGDYLRKYGGQYTVC
jgi:hypothetical protein